MTYYANVFFDFLLQKSLAGTLPATLAPFADRFTRQTADLDNARMRPFCAMYYGHSICYWMIIPHISVLARKYLTLFCN